MTPDFEPQFHKRIVNGDNQSVWVALPHPRTVIPVKASFYRRWQMEERIRLEKAGETVAPPLNGG